MKLRKFVLMSTLTVCGLLSAWSAGAAPLFNPVSPALATPSYLPATGTRQVVFNPAALDDMRNGTESEWVTANGEHLAVRWLHSYDHDSGNVTWVGDIAPFGQLNRAMLTFFAGGVTGTMASGVRNWEVATYGNATWLVDYAAAGQRLLGAGDHEILTAVKSAAASVSAPVRPASAPTRPASAPARAVSHPQRATLNPPPAPGVSPLPHDFPRSPRPKAGVTVSQVDVLIIATTELQNFFGGVTQTRAVQDRLMAYGNQVAADSGVNNLRFNLAGNAVLPGTQGLKIEQILNAYNPGRPEYVKTSGVAELREQTGADLVAILVPQDSTINGGHCGSANLPMLQRDLTTQAHEAYSVTASGPAFRGSEFKCGEDAVFIHELGHNFGLMHDRPTLVKQGAPLAQQNLEGGLVGAYAYGFGYGIQGKFCDIMCYSQNFGLSGPGNADSVGYNTTRPIFSNPNLTLPASVGGDKAGVAETDLVNSANATLALTNAVPFVSAYRNVPPKTFAVTTPIPVQTGLWWNPAQAGRGFFVEVQGKSVTLSGYLFGADGKPTWFLAAGPLVNNALTAPMQVLANGQTLTGSYKPPVALDPVGTLTLTFDEPDSASLVWPGGTLALERVNFEDGVDNTTETTLPFEALGDSGIWWNPAEPGRGYALDFQGDQLAVGAYMYDAVGNATWYFSVNKMTTFKKYQGVWQSFANGQTMTGAYKPAVVVPAVAGSANVTIDFLSPSTATLTLPDGRKVAISRVKF